MLPLARFEFLLIACWAIAGAANLGAQSPSADAKQTVLLELFVASDSEVSEKATRFAKELAERYRGLELIIHDVVKDREQLSRLWLLTRRSARDKPVVPAFLLLRSNLFWFQEPRGDRTGRSRTCAR